MTDLHPNAQPPIRPDTTEDARVTRTRRRLSNALLALALERPFETITIRDLTDRAEVGYATFFRHYDGIEDLLRDMLEGLLAELLGRLRPLGRLDPVAAGAIVFQHAAEQSDLYRLLLRTDRSIDLLDRAVRVGIENLAETHEAKSDSSVPADVAANHFVRSFINLIEWWLEHEMPYAPDRMADIYRDLILIPTEQAALRRR